MYVVPVTIVDWKGKQPQQHGQRVLVRFSLPYRVGEDFDLEMEMKKSDVRQQPMFDSKIIALIYRFRDSMVLHCPLVRLYEDFDDLSLLPVADSYPSSSL